MHTLSELNYVYEICGFAFQSRLDQHMLSHQSERTMASTYRDYTRKFKSVGDLSRHPKTHKKGGWFQCNYCSYKNKYKRSTKSHIRTHKEEDEEHYECEKCHKRM